MAEPGQRFVTRWSRRKAAVREAAKRDLAGDDDAPPAAEPTPPPELPPVESLSAESDYKPFLQPGVPEGLKRRALRKLWRSDPALANVDGLNDYDDDFTRAAFGKIVATAFRVGKGLIEAPGERPDEAIKSKDPDGEVAEASAEEPPGPSKG